MMADLSNLEKLRACLEKCDPQSVADAHLKEALEAVLDELERLAKVENIRERAMLSIKP
jgi:hypothetical protein